MQLRDPEACPKCGSPSRVVDSRKVTTPIGTYRWRRQKCHACGALWRSYVSLINPLNIRLRLPPTS